MSANERLGIELVVENVKPAENLEAQIRSVVTALQASIGTLDIFGQLKSNPEGLLKAISTLNTTFNEAFANIKKGVKDVDSSLNTVGASGFDKVKKGTQEAGKEIEELAKKTRNLKEELGKGFDLKSNTTGSASIANQIREATTQLNNLRDLTTQFNNLGMGAQYDTKARRLRHNDLADLVSARNGSAVPSLMQSTNFSKDELSRILKAYESGTFHTPTMQANPRLAVQDLASKAGVSFLNSPKDGDYGIPPIGGTKDQLKAAMRSVEELLNKDYTGANTKAGFTEYIKRNLEDVRRSLSSSIPQIETQLKELQRVQGLIRPQTLQSQLQAFGQGPVNTRKLPFVDPTVPTIPSTSPITQVATQVAQDAQKVKEATSKTLEEVKASFTSASGNTWGEFLKANKAAALEYTNDWHKAQKLLSEVFNSTRVSTPSLGAPVPVEVRKPAGNPEDIYLSKAIANEQDKAKVRSDIQSMTEKADSEYRAKYRAQQEADNRTKQSDYKSLFDEAIRREDALLAKAKAKIQFEKTWADEAKGSALSAAEQLEAKAKAKAAFEKRWEDERRAGELAYQDQLEKKAQAKISFEKKWEEERRLSELAAQEQLVKAASTRRKDLRSFDEATADLSGKGKAIDKISYQYPTANVSGLKTIQQEISDLIGKGGGKEELDVITSKLRILGKEMGAVRSEASMSVPANFTKQIDKAIEETFNKIGNLKNNAKLTAATLNDVFASSGIKFDSQGKIDAATAALRKYNVELKNGAVAAKEASFFSGIFGESIGRMAARLTEFYSLRTIIFAVTAQFREAVAAGMKFSQNIHDIAAISGASKTEMDSFGSSILTIARNSRFTADEVAKLMEVLAQAGVSASELPVVAETVGQFATATGTKPELAADLVTTGLNVYDIKATDTIKVTNALTAALNASKLTSQGLGTAFNYLAPQAEQLGMSMEHTLGIIAGMAQAGIKPSTIGTGTSQLLKELAAPKQRLKDMLAYYNIKQEDVDPIKNSFAQIVEVFTNATGKLGEKGVQVQHAMSALETRVGRSLITAMSLGSSAFEQMTEAVTGTNAAWIAFYKSMDGAQAKMNVVKQNFQSAIIGLFDTWSPVLQTLSSLLKDFTGWMNTSSGQAVVFASSLAALGGGIYTVAAALKALNTTAAGASFLSSFAFLANPYVLGGIALLTGIGVAYSVLATKTETSTEKLEKYTKAMFGNIEAIDKSSAGLKNAKEIASDGKESYAISQYEKAVRKYGETSEEANKIKDKHIKLTDSSKVALNKLIAEYPQYLSKLDVENVKIGDLVKAYGDLATARAAGATSDREEYNKKIGPELFLLAAEIKNDKKNLNNIIDEDGTGFALAQRTKEIQEKEKKYKELVRNSQPLRDRLSQEFKPTTYVEGDNAGVFQFGQQITKEPSTKPSTTSIPKSEKGISAEDKEKRIKDAENAFKQQTLEINAAVSKIKLEEMKAELKKDEDLAKYKEAANEELLERYAERLKAAKIKVNREIAQAVNGTYDEDTETIKPGKDYTVKDANRAVAAGQPKLTAMQTQIAEETFKENTAIFDTKLPAKKDTAIRDEKAEALRLRDEVFALNLQKQRAASADEQRQIEIKISEANIASAETVKNIYQRQKDVVEANKDTYKTTEEYESALSAAGDRVDELKFKIKEMNVELGRTKDVGVFSNIAEGARSALVAFGDMKSMMQSLGSSMMNTGVNGITDSLTSSVNAITGNYDKAKAADLRSQIAQSQIDKAQLQQDIAAIEGNSSKTPAEVKALADKKIALDSINRSLKQQQTELGNMTNGWKAFANGMKSVMKDILAEIQRYIIKMMVVKMMGSMFGMADGGKVTTNPNSLGSSGTPLQLAGGEYSAETGGMVTRTGIQRLADGGAVNGLLGGFVPRLPGTEWGKDGVPTLTAPGEVIIKKSSVDSLSLEKLLYMNDTGKWPKFADGGVVGGRSSAAPSGGDQILQIVNVTDMSMVPQAPVDARQVINIIQADASNRGPVYKTFKAIANG